MGFTAEFSLRKFLTVSALTVFLLILGLTARDTFIKLVWTVFFNFFYIGESIYYQFSIIGKPQILIGVSLFLVIMWMVSFIKFPKMKRVPKKDYFYLLTFLAIVMFIPIFIKYHGSINFSNLLLKDVYDTRASYKETSSTIIGYISEPLVRVLLPYLIIRSLQKKKKIFLVIFSLMILFVYLIGALKSILFGLLATVFFYFGENMVKERRFLGVISLFSWAGLIIEKLFNTPVLLDLAIRRVFFIPPYINEICVQYFSQHPTYLSHSPFGLGIVPYEYPEQLSYWIGDYLLDRNGMNANTGLFNEGFLSFGITGMLIFMLLIVFVFYYLRRISFNPYFFGILFTYIYYMNTSFLSVLLLTHGMFFFLIFAYFFLRKETPD